MINKNEAFVGMEVSICVNNPDGSRNIFVGDTGIIVYKPVGGTYDYGICFPTEISGHNFGSAEICRSCKNYRGCKRGWYVRKKEVEEIDAIYTSETALLEEFLDG